MRYFARSVSARCMIFALCAVAVGLPVGVRAAPSDQAEATAAPAATPDVEASPTPAAELDVFSGVLSDRQRKMLDRDSRCQDASSAAGAFVASGGKALQTGVDAMSGLEKCAVLPRVGADWADFRDYVITAAAALAYAVGSRANNEQLLRRAADDASHVSGFEANGNVTVTTYGRRGLPSSNDATGHGMQDGPAQSSARVVHNDRSVHVYAGPYGKVASDIARAATERLAEMPTVHGQEH